MPVAKASTARRLDDKTVEVKPRAARFDINQEEFTDADFIGVVPRRMAAFLVDLIAIVMIIFAIFLAGVIVTILTRGLAAPIVAASVPLVGFAYFTLMAGSSGSATIGMRLFDIELRTWDRRRPGYMQAAWHTVLFWASMSLTPIILIVAFFNPRNRCLHDFLAGTVMINATD